MKTYTHAIQKNLKDQFAIGLNDVLLEVQRINPAIHLAQTHDDIHDILALRKATYPKCLPEVQSDALEAIDYHSLLFFTKDSLGNISSTCRLVIDDTDGFAESYVYQPHIDALIKAGSRLAEWGRCIVTPHSTVRALDYTEVLTAVAKLLGIDHILIFNRACDVGRVLKKLKTAKVLCQTDITLGSAHKFSAILWSLSHQTNHQGVYEQTLWHDYAQSFSCITTTYQSELLNASATHLWGNVLDCGAGSAKIAPYLLRYGKVSSYTGIDACAQMCHLGEQLLEKIAKPNFAMKQSYIEDFETPKPFDTAVSINSLYTWSNPLVVLEHIYTLLKTGGQFVLASINDAIDMPKLAQAVTADLIAHPNFEVFRQINLQIQQNQHAHLLSLDDLIQLVHRAKFKVLKCHDNYYEGGLTFMVLTK